MIGIREIWIFTILVTLAFVAVVIVGFVYFTRWHEREKAEGRQHIDAHLAEILRESSRKD
jgi:hypothetical protein